MPIFRMTKSDRVIVRQCMERFCRKHREDRAALPIARQHITEAATRLIRTHDRRVPRRWRGRVAQWDGTIGVAVRRELDSVTTDTLMKLMRLVPERATAPFAMAN